jgi:biopolymer transport protein TolR
MGMSVGTGAGGIKAEPNVVPMIDIMLVLLIIFMVVTPALAAGFQATPPDGVNLKSHPEDDADQVLGIDKNGQYFLNKQPIRNETLAQEIKRIFDARTVDKILYIKADRELEYGKIIEAMDLASQNGVRVVGAITEQRPGTESGVAGDQVQMTETKAP